MKIIAESASNHQGNINYLIQLAEAAKEAGANYFTAQILSPEAFCDKTYSSIDVIKKIAIDQNTWKILFEKFKSIGIDFIPCAADIDSLNFCINHGFKLIKLHGTDLLNMPMLEQIAVSNIKVLVETQLATERDINLALNQFLFLSLKLQKT